MKIIKVHVNKHHIKNGVRCSNNSCPVALALKDLGFTYVNVLYMNGSLYPFGTKAVCHNDKQIFFSLSNPAIEFIHNFDHKRKVKPATFVLKVT